MYVESYDFSGVWAGRWLVFWNTFECLHIVYLGEAVRYIFMKELYST